VGNLLAMTLLKFKERKNIWTCFRCGGSGWEQVYIITSTGMKRKRLSGAGDEQFGTVYTTGAENDTNVGHRK
jgi:hypothetical protein